MPGPRGGRGGKKHHKGQRRHFTNEEDLAHSAEKEARQKAWRRQKGIESDEEEEEEKKEDTGAAKEARGAPGDLPPSDSEEESSDEDDKEAKPKGVAHLIEVSNPNRVREKTKKVAALASAEDIQGPQLSRREREELQKQQAAAHYRKMHLEGKTDEARADLARLAIIRKQREDAAKKKEEERKAQEAAKLEAEKKLKQKKQAAQQ